MFQKLKLSLLKLLSNKSLKETNILFDKYYLRFQFLFQFTLLNRIFNSEEINCILIWHFGKIESRRFTISDVLSPTKIIFNINPLKKSIFGINKKIAKKNNETTI